MKLRVVSVAGHTLCYNQFNYILNKTHTNHQDYMYVLGIADQQVSLSFLGYSYICVELLFRLEHGLSFGCHIYGAMQEG